MASDRGAPPRVAGCSRFQAITRPPLPAPTTSERFPAGRCLGEQRRDLEVVVADVVRRHLVVPADSAGGGVQRQEGVGIERCPGVRAATLGPDAASRPTAPGWPCRRRRSEPFTESGFHAPPPPPASSGWAKRPRIVGRPPQDPAAGGVDRRRSRRSEPGAVADGRRVDSSAGDDRRDRRRTSPSASAAVAASAAGRWTRSRANSVVSVLPYTRPFDTATPRSGPACRR